MTDTPFPNAKVAAVFDAYPEPTLTKLLALRRMIYEVAAEIDGVGELEETLKWGQPSYLTSESKSGTTIRIDRLGKDNDPKDGEARYGMFVHCQTTLVDAYRTLYADVLTFDGNRAILFDVREEIPHDVVKHCVAMALTYHTNK